MRWTGVAVALVCTTAPALAGDAEKPKPAPAPSKQPAPKPAAPKPAAPKPAAPVMTLRVMIDGHKALSSSSLEASEVASKVDGSYYAGLERCYEAAFGRSAGGNSAVTLAFQVTAAGATAAVRAKSAAGAPSLESCIVGQAASWKFDAPKSAAGAPVAAGFELRLRIASADEAEALAMADMLTGDGGSAEADMSNRTAGGSLAAQIEAVKSSGHTVAVGGGGGKGGRATPGGPAAPGGGTPAAPSGRVSVASKQALDESSLTPDAVLMKIQSAYFAGIKRCYKELLKSDPTARGRLTLALTVTEEGRVASATAKGLTASLETCVGGQMAHWRFAVPRDEKGRAVDAAFELTLHLIP